MRGGDERRRRGARRPRDIAASVSVRYGCQLRMPDVNGQRHDRGFEPALAQPIGLRQRQSPSAGETPPKSS